MFVFKFIKFIKFIVQVYLYDPFVGKKHPHKLVIEIKNQLAKNFVIQQANGRYSCRQCLRYALEFATIVLSGDNWRNNEEIYWSATNSRK
jgi:hypothetical protein